MKLNYQYIIKKVAINLWLLELYKNYLYNNFKVQGVLLFICFKNVGNIILVLFS